ncbi:MAG: hypothetical protein RSB77_03500 [Bacilli bacterium]
MGTKLTEEKYKELKKLAIQEHKKFNVEQLEALEKDKLVTEQVQKKNFENDEMREIFIANFLIPDDQKFYQTYIDNGKSIKKSAEILNVPDKVVFTRVFELGKYSSYITNLKGKKGEDKMKEIEIIDTLPLGSYETKEENIVEDGANYAITKINMLIEANEAKDKTIDSQTRTIKKLNDDVDTLQYQNNEQNDMINNLESDKSKLEHKCNEQDNMIKQYEKERMILLKYKENYDKIVSFLAKNEQKVQNEIKKV